MDNELVPVFTLKMRIVDYSLMLKNSLLHQQVAASIKLVRWNSLGGTGMILNVDDSSLGNPGVSGFGGLIRNSDGAWVHGFYGNLGVSNILHAELMAIYKGLLLAWEMNIKELWCYSDSKTAISLITEPVDEWHHYAAIIHNIKDIITRDWQVIVSHTLREGNVCADYLAKHGAHNNEAFTTITNPPAGLSLPLLMDSSKTWFPG
jgi:ribonuclease HI